MYLKAGPKKRNANIANKTTRSRAAQTARIRTLTKDEFLIQSSNMWPKQTRAHYVNAFADNDAGSKRVAAAGGWSGVELNFHRSVFARITITRTGRELARGRPAAA